VSRGLADTSVFIGTERGRALDVDRLPDEIVVSIITIGELRAGILAAADVNIRDRRLRTLMRALELQPSPIDEPVADAWSRLESFYAITGSGCR
jgi:predicted nucleic acid-binding protein